jgi:superfamily I DNA and/or RNA helicase
MSGTDQNRPPLPSSFFYNNIFWNEKVATALRYKVKDNLGPFLDLLKNLIDHNDRLRRISANISPVDNVIKLRPEFCMVKLENETRYEMPKGNYYILEWKNDEYGSIEDFIEITCRNRNFVLTTDNKIDSFDGYVIFESEHEPKGALTLYYNHRGHEKNATCEIKKVNFQQDFGNYRISSREKISDIRCEKNTIIIPNISDEDITLFDRIKIKRITNGEKIDSNKFTANEKKKVRALENGFCIVYDNNVKKLLYDNKQIRFEKVPEEEYSVLLNDENIIVNGRSLALEKGDIDTDGRYHSNYDTTFKCETGEIKTRKKFPEGVFVHVDDDGSLESDIFTSASMFFREEIEELTDIEKNQNNLKDGRKFRIGKKREEESIIEIVEIENEKRIRMKGIPKKLYLVPNPYQLLRQRDAINKLVHEPSVHHESLLKLMNSKTTWEDLSRSYGEIRKWYMLKDGYDGVEKQYEMVKLALSTKDFAFLEGPPGSGKTTTILEIIAQMIDRGKRVMLVASTNAAVDNVLERLNKLPAEIGDKILAVRIGNDDSMSEAARKYNPYNSDNGLTKELRETILDRANLVCGTTFGILRHPEFDLAKKGKMIPPLFDCLIIDEASKTTFQEFLVPAVFARKWILSGDIKQLTPYIEKEDIASSIQYMKDFNEELQEIQGIIQQLSIDNNLGKCRFCIPIPQRHVQAFEELVPPNGSYICITNSRSNNCVPIEDLLSGGPDAYKLYGARYIFVQDDYFDQIQPILPNDVIVLLRKEEARTSYYANKYHFENRGILASIKDTDYRKHEIIRDQLNHIIRSKSWSGEIAWRIVRQQELFMLRDVQKGDDKVGYIEKEINRRIPEPFREPINKFLDLIRELALPSILRLLQIGISEKTIEENNKTVLNSGFEPSDYKKRSVILEYQSRMHSDISEFSRTHIYRDKALRDSRSLDRSWNHTQDRSVWIDVHNDYSCNNENEREIQRIVEEIKKFAEYSENNPKTQDPEDKGYWSIAVLSYYKAQVKNIKVAIAKLTENANPNKSMYEWNGKNIRIEVYTVDKYQGKEADIVFLSLIKTGRANLGFMDSPNRLNVALTRAKFKRYIVGNRHYFRNKKNYLLRELEGSIS